ncbi:MAG: ChbG/HpnK family deacetylase [Proteobacteria bacterium]|jgi:chitin disaccharide deacetylase|nr:ChbG/HpnK family deacetylase [Pseudomonadota bacterium]
MIKRQYNITAIVAWAVAIIAASVVCAEDSATKPSLAEWLGYSSDASLLIVHADDVGFSRSAHSAAIQVFESGPLQTGAIMVPAPWFPEIAAFVQEHPQHDFGVYITLISKWKTFK